MTDHLFFSPVFRAKKQKEPLERKFFFLKNNRKKQQKNISLITQLRKRYHIYARTEDARARQKHARGGSSSFGLNNPSFFFLSVERFLSFGF